MTDLKIIENKLVPVYEKNIGEKIVYSSELHRVLKSKQDFSTWVKKSLNKCDVVENTDYTTAPQNYGTANGGYCTRLEYIFKLDTAKEMLMLKRNEKAKQVKKYSVNIEKKYKHQQIDSAKLSFELQIFKQMFDAVSRQEVKLNQLEEKINKVKDNTSKIAERMQTVADTFVKAAETENFNKWVNKTLSIIANNSILKAIYTTTVKEMLLAYCVEAGVLA